MSPSTPASPGHFDRFNFCNSAPEWELEISAIWLDGNQIFGPPFAIGPMMVDHLNGCMANRDAPQVRIQARASRMDDPAVQMHYDETYTASAGAFLNNVAFGIMQRCVGFDSDAVFFGEVEITDAATNVTSRALLP